MKKSTNDEITYITYMKTRMMTSISKKAFEKKKLKN